MPLDPDFKLSKRMKSRLKSTMEFCVALHTRARGASISPRRKHSLHTQSLQTQSLQTLECRHSSLSIRLPPPPPPPHRQASGKKQEQAKA